MLNRAAFPLIAEIGGIKFRTSDKIPPDEIWAVQPTGYEKHESVSPRGDYVVTISERFRIVGKIVNLR